MGGIFFLSCSMKKTLLLVLCFLGMLYAQATERMHFVRSKPFSLLVFTRAAAGDVHLSRTLIAYIKEHVPVRDSARFYELVREFNTLDMNLTYVIPGQPAQRTRPKSTGGLIYNAAIHCRDMDEFMQRITGILSNEQWLRLGKILRGIEPYYDRMMGAHERDMQEQLSALQDYDERAGAMFDKLRKFYGSTWADDEAFTVALYTIPGREGNSTAAPYNNTLALGVFSREKIFEERVCIAMHEVCHVLYEEQPMKLQQKLDRYFAQSNSPYAAFAYNYLDEGLATACGNGWAYWNILGRADTGKWYANRYINNYGKALFPLVRKYIESGREIDQAFVNRAIELFTFTFPDAPYEYENLLNSVNIYTDADEHDEYASVCAGIGRHFQITNSNGHYPMTDADAMGYIKNEPGTQLFIIHRDHRKELSVLQKVFPQLRGTDPAQEGIMSFFDDRKRAIVVVNVRNADRVEKAAALLEKLGKIDRSVQFIPLEKKG